MYKFLSGFTIICVLCMSIMAADAPKANVQKLEVVKDCCIYDTYYAKDAPNSIIGHATGGTQYDVTGVYGDYAKISADKIVWTAKLDISADRKTAVVIDQGVSIRAYDAVTGKKGEPVGLLKAGEKINIEIIPTWYQTSAGWFFVERVKLIK